MSTMGGRKHCEARTRGQWFDVGRKDGLETMDFRVSWRKSWRAAVPRRYRKCGVRSAPTASNSLPARHLR